MAGLIIFAACVGLAPAALAVDGVVEISQVGAIAGGVTPGDTAGYPVSLTTSGSYVLTSNLTVTGTSAAISIDADDVTVDLNGFTISGPVICSGSGSTLQCSTGASSGAGVQNNSYARLTVRDGVIRGFFYGVVAGESARVERLTITDTLQDGIYGLDGLIAVGNHVRNAADEGIEAQNRVQIRDNIIEGCTATGLVVANAAVVRGNTLSQNGAGMNTGLGAMISENSVTLSHSNGFGIFAAGASTVSRNTVYANTDGGIITGDLSLVEQNSVTNNTGAGISVLPYSSVQRNLIANNTGIGLGIAVQSSFRENTITNNTLGTTGGLGIDMLGNSCDGATTCP